MRAAGAGEGRAVVLRALSSAIAFWAVAGLTAVFVVDAAVRGRVGLALRAGAILAFVVWCVWVFTLRMSVRMDATALLARNLLRWVRVPWRHVVDIERRAQLRVILDDGSRVECWGSPFPPRTGAGAGRGRGARPRAGADGALATVRAAWQSGRLSDEPVSRGWDIPALLSGVVLAALAVIALVG